MNSKGKAGLINVLIIVGIWIAYVQQMAPSPLLVILREHFNIVNNDALLNLSVSIVFPMFILASIVGGIIEQKIGTRKLYIWTLSFLSMGILINYIATTYVIFLLGRALFGIGFGLGIPFIGSAIMKWYTPKQREIMTTINGLFPFIGTVVSFGFLVPLYDLFDKSWQNAIGIWGFGLVIIGILWTLLVKEHDVASENTAEIQEAHEKNLYLNLWRRRDIKLLCIAFMCDFFCYSYLAVILPTLLLETSHMTEAAAGFWAAIAFPAVGIIGCSVGGIAISSTGKRKPSMALGQILKFVGISVVTLGASFSVWFVPIGAAIFGFGNSLWMPGMYMIPMELEGMTPTRVGAAFAFISSCGFISGFISPILGGWLTNLLMSIASLPDPVINHIFGLKWSLFIFGFTNLIAFACILRLKETGSSVQKEKLLLACCGK